MAAGHHRSRSTKRAAVSLQRRRPGYSTPLGGEHLESRRLLTMPEATVSVMNPNNEAGPLTVNIVLSAPPETAVAVTLEIRDSTGALATADFQQPSTVVGFEAGQTHYANDFYPIDDAIVEWVEEFDFTLTNPQGVTLGANSVASDWVYDNDLAVSELAVEWKRLDGGWESVPTDEVLWLAEEHHWISSFDPPPELQIDRIEWLCRPWDLWEADPVINLATFDDDWVVFAFADSLEPAGGDLLGELYAGVWAVTARVRFGIWQGFLIADEPVKEQVIEIVETKWSRGADGQKFVGDGLGATRVFPERDKPSTQMQGELHDKVKIDVRIDAPIAADKRAVVHVKAFDPDHEFTPTNAAEVNSRFDPNDAIDDPTPEDNIAAGVWARPALQGPPATDFGGTVLDEALEFLPGGGTQKSAQFQITARQPGNNFLAVAHQRLGFLSALEFMDDGVSLHMEGEGGPAPGNQTGILTVWRTLHLELDGMKKPTPEQVLLGGFNDTDPHADDPVPAADIAPPPWNLVATEFLPAMVEVVDDLAPYESPKKKADFEHYFGPAGHTPLSESKAKTSGDSVRNVPSEADFWVVQLISGYEYVEAEDIDDNAGVPDTNTETWIAGYAINLGNDGPTFVFSEVIRDVWTNYPLRNAGLSLDLWHRRTSLHEVAHRFDMYHGDVGGIGDEGPLSTANNLGAPAAPNEFTMRQLARIQATQRPR